MKHTLAMIIIGMLLGKTVLAKESLHLIKWQKEPKAYYYWGNIYIKDKIIRFRTDGLSYFIPSTSIVEVYAHLPTGNKYLLALWPRHRKDYKTYKKSYLNQPEQDQSQDFIYYDYLNEPEIDDPELAATQEGQEDSILEFSPITAAAPQTKITELPITYTGQLSVSQDEFKSKGLVGTLDGTGISNTLQMTASIGQMPFLAEQNFIEIALSVSQFETEVSQTTVSGSTTQALDNQLLAMAMRFGSPVWQTPNLSILGFVGLRYEQLPFLETSQEESGLSELSQKSSLGFELGLKIYPHEFESFYSQIVVIPLSASTTANQQLHLVLGWQPESQTNWRWGVEGGYSQQYIAYSEECAVSNSGYCKSPQTTYQKLGIGGYLLYVLP